MALADPRSFVRGLAYQRDDRVEISKRGRSAVVAVVRGSLPYEVELHTGAKPAWSCTCPVGEDGTFCKHCVAVALAVADPEPASTENARTRTRRAKEPDLRRYLASLDANVLVDMVMEHAAADWRVRERLQAAATAAGGGSLDMRTWTARIDAVFGGGEFVPYSEAGGWAQDVFDVLAALDDLVEAGHAAARLAPGLSFTHNEDYVMWGVVGRSPLLGAEDGDLAAMPAPERHRLACAAVAGENHPAGTFLPAASPEESFFLAIRAVPPPEPWARGPVTLLGDAIHAAPVNGTGANSALRDAALLCRQLNTVTREGVPLDLAVARYEGEMLGHARLARQAWEHRSVAGMAGRAGEPS